jgi:hypothetical protein
MRVLIACEYSGVVRDAFLAQGHDAMSCDLLPSDAPGPHYQGDVFDIIDRDWDLMIAHPPCTYLTNSGVRWLHSDPTRWQDLIAGAVFFRRLLEAPINCIAIENPVMHKYAAAIIGRRQSQIVQPWMFGHPEQKATGLWLKGLPPLVPTHDVKAHMMTLPTAERNRIHYASPGPDRWKLRSATYTGVARAMADQWRAPDPFWAAEDAS